MSDDNGVAVAPVRLRLPNRRPTEIAQLATESGGIAATVGFDPVTWHPRELFLSGAKPDSGLAAILDDAAVVISVALQCGVPAAMLARSIARLPAEYGGGAASPIGAALDLLVRCERGDE